MLLLTPTQHPGSVNNAGRHLTYCSGSFGLLEVGEETGKGLSVQDRSRPNATPPMQTQNQPASLHSVKASPALNSILVAASPAAVQQQGHTSAPHGVSADAPAALPAPTGPSAAASPVTPSAAETPPTAARVAPQQAGEAPSTAAAAVAAAAAAVGCSKHLDGSLLLHHLLPLTASLGSAVKLGDLSRMQIALTLLQSVPMTGQLLFASQAAAPVRSILQQQAQLQAQCMQNPQQLQLLQAVAATARQLLKRWKALLSAEVATTDPAKKSRARQVLRSNRKLSQQCSQSHCPADSAAADSRQHQPPSGQGQAGKTHHTPQQQTNTHHGAPHHPTPAAAQLKRSYGGWLLEQHRQQPRERGPSPSLPPAIKKHKQGHSGGQQAQLQNLQGTTATQGFGAAGAASCYHISAVHKPNSTRGCAAPPAAAGGAASFSSAGASLARSCSGFFTHSSSSFSLGIPPGSSTDDLAALGLDLDLDTPLTLEGPVFGAEAAAAADAALDAAATTAVADAPGGALWGCGEGDDDVDLLVEPPGTVEGCGQDTAAFMFV